MFGQYFHLCFVLKKKKFDSVAWFWVMIWIFPSFFYREFIVMYSQYLRMWYWYQRDLSEHSPSLLISHYTRFQCSSQCTVYLLHSQKRTAHILKKAHRSLETLMHLVGSKGGGKWALIQLEASESDECISMELPFLNIFQNNACIYCRWISDASEESIHRMKYHELCNESIINTIWFWFASICF